MKPVALTPNTAARLKRLLGGEGDAARLDRGDRPSPRRASLVRCTSEVAASGTAPGSGCYPAEIVVDPADATEPNVMGTMWLTLWDADGLPAQPNEGQIYTCIISGSLDIGGDERPRAFAPEPQAGEAGPPACVVSLGGSAIQYTTGWRTISGLSLRLPAAGSYLVTWTAAASGMVEAGSFSWGSYILGRLYNCTAGATLTIGSSIVSAYAGHVLLAAHPVPETSAPAGSPFFATTTTITQLVTVTEPSDVIVQAVIDETRGTPFSLAHVNVPLLNYVAVSRETECQGSGCTPGSGSGDTDPGGGLEDQSYFDLGATATAEISGGTGGCVCLDGITWGLTQSDPERWDGAPDEIDTSGCEDGDATDRGPSLVWSAAFWNVVGLFTNFTADIEFISQDDVAKTVVVRVTGTVSVGSSVCTGTFVITFTGAP